MAEHPVSGAGARGGHRHAVVAGDQPATADVFIGRERELAELCADLDEAVAGRGRLAMVVGEPGIGKTRLADELALRAADAGALVLWGRCSEDAGAPLYWPWVQIMRSWLHTERPERLLSGTAAAYVAEIVPEVRAQLPEVPELPQEPSDDDARFALLDAVASLLLDASQDQPLLLLLDDLHASDLPSLLLLRLLARRTRDGRLLLYAAYRPPEARAQERIGELLGEIAREGKTIHLQGLDHDEVREFVAAATQQPPPTELVRSLYERTEGNPLFVSEMVRLLDSQGRLRADEVARAWTVAIPEGVQQTIRRRLSLLSPAVLAILEVAAVLGREFDLAPLQRMWDAPSGQLLEALSQGTAANVLAEGAERPFSYRFVHPLVHQTLYRDLPPERRASLHQRAAEALEQDYRGNVAPHLAELAHHYFEAAPVGDVDKAVTYTALAAERAAGLHAYEEAAAAYERAIHAMSLLPAPDERRRCELLLELGQVQNRAGEVDAGQDSFLRAAEAARALGSPQLLAKAAVGYGRETSTSGAVDPTLVALLEEALAALEDEDGLLYIDVATRLAIELYYDDAEASAARRAELARDAVAMARRVGDPTMLSYALEASTLATAGPDNVEERLATGTEIIRLADDAGRREGRQSGHVWRLAALLELGDSAAVDREIEDYARLAEELRQPAHLWYAAMVRATRALLAGRFEEAERLAAEALEIGERGRSEEAAEYHAVQRFTLLRQLGRRDELAAMLDPFRELVGRYPALPAFRAALTLIELETGRRAEAVGEFEALAARDFSDLPRNLGFLAAVALLAEVCVELGAADRAALLYDLLLPYADHFVVFDWSIACYGSVSYYLGLLASLQDRREDAVEHLRAAVTANTSIGAAPFVAQAQLELARALLAAGEGAAAREAATSAASTANQLGMDPVAATAQALQEAQPVTPAASAPARALFTLEGEYWTVAYEGRQFRLRSSKGLRYLAVLLRHPGREFHVLDLAATLAGDAPDPAVGVQREEALEVGRGDAGALLDAEAKAAYRRRLDALREELEEAEAMHDPERASRARAERDFLVAELARAVGLGGRDVRAASDAERARQSVRRSVKSCLVKIRAAHPALGEHLAATVRTGYFCSYTPDPRAAVQWEM